ITVPADLADLDGLPMRVPQANLAPELRKEPVVVTAEQSFPAPEPPADPDEARNLMSALQRGWERGRTASGSNASPEDSSPADADADADATDAAINPSSESPDHDSQGEER